MASFIGRKTSLYIAVVLIYVSNIVMMTTDTIGGLYAGRFVIGVGNGFLMTFSQLYIQVYFLYSKNQFVKAFLTSLSRNAHQHVTEASC